MFTIAELKKHLGPGLGLRKNKYLLEIPIPGIDGGKINVLARSAGLPERSIQSTQIFHKGRMYNVRGETDYGGSYEVSIVDDSDMFIRRKFDDWLTLVDDSSNGRVNHSSYELGVKSALDRILNNGKSTAANDFYLGETQLYQTDINIWQLSGNNDKIYGYKLQNAFPAQLGIVTLDDGDQNTLSEFSVNFSFSEFVPLEGIPSTQITDALTNLKNLDVKAAFDTLQTAVNKN